MFALHFMKPDNLGLIWVFEKVTTFRSRWQVEASTIYHVHPAVRSTTSSNGVIVKFFFFDDFFEFDQLQM